MAHMLLKVLSSTLGILWSKGKAVAGSSVGEAAFAAGLGERASTVLTLANGVHRA